MSWNCQGISHCLESGRPGHNISMVKCKFACECLGYVDVMVRWVAEQMDTGFVNR